MMKNTENEAKRPLLVMIGGAPWVGKTVCARELFNSLDNAAWLDGDSVWQVNPFSTDDPRIRKGDKNVSFVLNTYLELDFDYVVYSSVLLGNREIADNILDAIEVRTCDRILFMLVCSMDTLKERSYSREGETSPDTYFMNEAVKRDAVHIDNTDLTPKQAAERILSVIQDLEGNGLAPVTRDGIREWKLTKE